jgi:hypothetical protein
MNEALPDNTLLTLPQVRFCGLGASRRPILSLRLIAIRVERGL